LQRVQEVNPGELTVPAVAAAVKPFATMKLAAAGKTSADKALVREPSAAKGVATEIAVKPTLESAPSIVTRTKKAAAVKPVEPRAGADKHATREPLRSVITVRRAGVRVIPIIAVRTDRWRANVSPAVVGRSVIIAGAHSHKHPLCIRKGCEEQANPE
jgi:hypothetical protein